MTFANIPKALATATCSRMEMSGMRPIAAPNSEQISENPKIIVVFPIVRFIENGGSSNGGSPAWMLPENNIFV